MQTLVLLVGFLISISIFTYAWLVLTFFRGWLRLRQAGGDFAGPYEAVSIVVACRNEGDQIRACLKSIIGNSLPPSMFEVIIVDDHSDDATTFEVERFIEEHPGFLLSLHHLSPLGKNGKKEAVKFGVEKARHGIILTTDADCKVPVNWIKSLTQAFSDNTIRLVCGPVSYFRVEGFFQRFQLLDFLSLIGAGAGAIGAGKAFMGNAANMAFRKDVFLAAQANRTDNEQASGDDVFLLQTVKKMYPNGITFIKSSQAIVYTLPQKNLDDLINQRIRWASKSKSYPDFFAMLVAASVFDINLSVVILFFLGFVYPVFLQLCLLLFIVKFIIDFPLLHVVTRFMKRTDVMFYYLPIQLLYPFYMAYVGVYALATGRYYWKGRLVR